MSFLIPWRKNRLARSEVAPAAVFNEFDRLFDDFFAGFGLSNLMGRQEGVIGHYPKIELSEGNKDIVVRAELPGLDPKDLDVTFQDDILTLKGEIKSEKGDGQTFSERNYGRFQRSIQLPSEVDGDSIKATFKNGILSIEFKKVQTQDANVKRIEITS